MRFRRKVRPPQDTERTVMRFTFWPMKIERFWVWLERYCELQVYRHSDYCDARKCPEKECEELSGCLWWVERRYLKARLMRNELPTTKAEGPYR